MNKSFIFNAVLMLVAFGAGSCSTGSDKEISQKNIDYKSTEVLDNGKVAFRLYAPEAEAVAVRKVNGEFPVYRIVTGAPDISEKTMVPCQDGQWHLELTEAGSIVGYLYRPDINSFAADIYLGMQPEGGEERFYYTLQTILPENQGLMEGRYSCFSVNAQEMETGTYHVFLYLEVKDTCYQVDAGMLTLN